MRVVPALTQRRRLAASIAAAIIVADQATKRWAEAALADGPIELIPGLLSFSFAENTGASFSLFQGGGQIIGVAAFVATVVIWIALASAQARLEVVGLGLILGGAVGNVIDRILRADGILDGAVIDFVELPNFPNFNVADSAITIGAALLLWSAFRTRD